jgi:hypothetical protein
LHSFNFIGCSGIKDVFLRSKYGGWTDKFWFLLKNNWQAATQQPHNMHLMASSILLRSSILCIRSFSMGALCGFSGMFGFIASILLKKGAISTVKSFIMGKYFNGSISSSCV